MLRWPSPRLGAPIVAPVENNGGRFDMSYDGSGRTLNLRRISRSPVCVLKRAREEKEQSDIAQRAAAAQLPLFLQMD